jgi:outer membrane protein assembly factor BamB
VYIGSDDNNLYCLDASTGAEIWRYTTGDAIQSSPAVSNGLVYFGSLDHWVYAVDAQNGNKIWSFQTGSGVYSSPAIADGKVYIGSYDKKVYCLNAGTGELIWSYQVGDIVHSSPAVADNKVFVGSYDGNLYCFASEFVVSVTPTSGTVSPGGTNYATVNVKIIGGANVQLSAIGAPNDMVVSFDPSSGAVTFDSTMTIKTTSNTPPGTYDIQIVGTGGGKTRTTIYRIQVGNIFMQEALLFIPLILLLLIIPTLMYWWKMRKKYRQSKIPQTGRQTRGILRT